MAGVTWRRVMVSSATRWRISGVAGLLFVIISFVASAINVQPPPYTQDSAAIAAWFAENSQQYRVGHFVAGLAFLLFYVPFFAGFCEQLRAAEGTPAIWSRVTWGGAMLSPAAGTAAGAFIVGAALLGGNVSGEAAALALAGQFYAFVVSGALAGIVMLGASVVILRTGVFSSWLGWAGVLTGMTAIVGSAALVENDPAGPFASINGFAWLAYFLWLAALSIAMVRGAPRLQLVAEGREAPLDP
ncbi:MAG: DUF4386 family protein [Acidobacteria bacterium]|nr:MAG: DUF4386 family protein [Acidobacteriota bacterium]